MAKPVDTLLGEFHAQYPEIRVEMVLANDNLDLISGENDVALRIGSSLQPILQQMKENLRAKRYA